MKTNKTPLADIMRELTASAQYRKVVSEMNKLQRQFATIRHVHITNPSEQTLEMLRDQKFTVERTKITEYVQFKISW